MCEIYAHSCEHGLMQKPDCVLIDTENIAGMDVSMNEWISERYEKHIEVIVKAFVLVLVNDLSLIHISEPTRPY